MELLHLDDANASLSKLRMGRVNQVVKSTVASRQAVKASLGVENEVLLDSIADLLEAEGRYQSRMDVLQNHKTAPGKPSVLSTLPDFIRSRRGASKLSLLTESPIADLSKTNPRSTRDPLLNASLIEMMDLILTVNRELNLYGHRIRSAYLQVMHNLRKIDKLNSEATDAKGGK